MDKIDYAGKVAMFLTERKGTPLSVWQGKMTATEQRNLMGVYLGKGTIVIDGEQETIEHYVKVCFGLDSSLTKSINWKNL